MSTISCGLCRQTFDASEELCGDCLEETDDTWRLNLGANLAAAGMAATIEDMQCFDYCGPRRRCQRCGAMTTMREAVS